LFEEMTAVQLPLSAECVDIAFRYASVGRFLAGFMDTPVPPNVKIGFQLKVAVEGERINRRICLRADEVPCLPVFAAHGLPTKLPIDGRDSVADIACLR
jgi:hypothetical protein